MTEEDPYRGITCSAYDLLELWSMRKSKVKADWLGRNISGLIENLITDSEGEWAIWSGGEKTRLDHLKRIEEAK
jgi:transcriptional antiterminator Rof (Rho-off)